MHDRGILRRISIYILLSIPIPFVLVESVVWWKHRQFYQSMSEERLLGKTPAQIQQLLGKPAGRMDYSDGNFDFIYEGEDRAVSHVDFTGGVVVRVEHLSG